MKKYCFSALSFFRTGSRKKGFYGPLVDDLLGIRNSIHKPDTKCSEFVNDCIEFTLQTYSN